MIVSETSGVKLKPAMTANSDKRKPTLMSDVILNTDMFASKFLVIDITAFDVVLWASIRPINSRTIFAEISGVRLDPAMDDRIVREEVEEMSDVEVEP